MGFWGFGVLGFWEAVKAWWVCSDERVGAKIDGEDGG